MSPLARRALAGSTVVVMAGCIVPTLAIPIAHGSMLGLFGPDLGGAVSFALTGAFLLLRVRGPVTKLAVIMCLQGIGASVTSLTIVLFHLAALSGPLRGFGLWVAWLNGIVWVPALVLLTPLILLFPSGTLAGRGWRWLIVAAGGFGALFEVTAVIGRHSVVDETPFDFAPNPTAFIDLGPAYDVVGTAGFIGLIACFGISLASLTARRRHALGVERAQLTSLLFGAAISVAVLGFVAAQPNVLESDLLVFAIELFAILPVPASIAFAVLRHRLFDIDRIVSRTVAYAMLVAILIGVYAGVVAGFAYLVPASFGQIGVAVATLLVAFLALPLARRIRNAVDRRFDRSRYDAQQEIAEFAARLRVRPDGGDNISADVLSVVQRTLAPTTAGVWVAAHGPAEDVSSRISHRP